MAWGIGFGIVAALIVQRLVDFGLRKIGGKRAIFGTWKFWLIFLGISAAITMVATSTISVAMITIIGIPIGIYLMAAPFLFLVVFGTWFLRRWLGEGWMGTGSALVVTLALLAAPPYFANLKLEAIGKAQVAGDLDEGTMPKGKSIAVRYDRYWGKSKGVLNCDGFCQRALINGVAERVMMVEQDLNLAIDPMLEVDSFRLEKRAFCAPVQLPQGYDPIKIREEQKDWKGKRVDELMQLEIAKGNCLIAEESMLGTADVILSVGRARQGKNTLTAGLFLLADTVNADRIAMHERQGTAYTETYRKTFVVTYKLAPLYAPTAEGGSELRMYPALARLRETINIDEKYYETPDWTAFLTGRLGYDLGLRRENAENETRAVLKESMLSTGDAVPMPAQVADNFFQSVNSKSNIEGEDLVIARQLLDDERFPVSRWAASAIRNAQGAPQNYFDAIAAAMFKRLRAHAGNATVKAGSGWHEELSAIGGVLGAMPRETILKHREDLEWLAHQDAVRVQAHDVLQRFADFGADGVDMLLWLIDDAQRYRETNGNDWQHPYLAGMMGLCKMGAQGRKAIQPLYDRLDSGVIANWASYHRLAVHTLVRMGANPEEIWMHAQEKGKNASKDAAKARSQFDLEVSQAMKREECWY
jgi:hypothetical protein